MIKRSIAWLLTATDLVDTDQLSRWVVTPKGTDRLYCEVDVTAIAGGGSVKFEVIACKPSNILDDGCTDITDGDVWYLGSAVSTVTTDRIAILPFTTTGEETSMSDVEIVGPLPPLWAIQMNETGSTTLTYTVDCVWQ